MAEFLTTQGTSYHLENIIVNASKWLVLVSPYLNITQNFLQRLQDADKNKVKIYIIYGKKELKPEEELKLQKLHNLYLRYYKNLHAKCYSNEDAMIITSMNLLEFSEKTNREMGILIRKDDPNK
jgi:late competence protein required for DNA uptake (superfamily II DNA/RNA helicase)